MWAGWGKFWPMSAAECQVKTKNYSIEFFIFLRAKLVQLRIILVRLGDAGLIRQCWRRGSAADKRFSY